MKTARTIENAPEPLKTALTGLKERGLLDNPAVRHLFLAEALKARQGAKNTPSDVKPNNPRS